MNTPYNHKPATKHQLPNTHQIHQHSTLYTTTNITCQHWTQTLQTAQPGDLIYLDPPYIPTNPKSFTKYTKHNFTHQDHQHLAKTLQTLTQKGIYWIMSNSDTPQTRQLYEGHITELNGYQTLNKPQNSKEIIIRNYTT